MRKKLSRVIGLTALIAMGLATVAHAEDYNKFGVRVRGVYVAPNASIDSRLSPLSLSVSDDVVPGVDLEYFITKNISTELFAAVTRHDIKASDQFIGSTWLLPPTLTAKYHPMAGASISPYIGAGVNVTLPFHSKLNGHKEFSIDNTVGWVAQAGVDIKIKDNVFFNIDYKYVNVDTKMRIDLGAGNEKFKLDVNPNLFGVGLGYRF